MEITPQTTTVDDSINPDDLFTVEELATEYRGKISVVRGSAGNHEKFPENCLLF